MPSFMNYCLMGTKHCYTDWHIDFGGTSVWYHIIYGGKLFIVVQPTPDNLRKYEQWEKLDATDNIGKKRRTGFIQYCEGIKEPIPSNSIARIELTTGDTLLMPAGWIHCVITTEDSLVFGGNLLHSYCAKMQLRIRKLEMDLGMPKKYTVGGFDKLHWYALIKLGTELIEHADEYNPSKTLIQRFGAKKFEAITIIIEYLQDKTNNKEDIPDNIPEAPLPFIKKLKGLLQDKKSSSSRRKSSNRR